MSSINQSVAVLLCGRIREDNGCHWYSLSGLTCKMCMRSSNGNPVKMKMYRKGGYQGCRLINEWYDKLSGTKGKEKLNQLI